MGRHSACIVPRIMRTTRSCNRKGHFAFIIYGLFCRVTSAYRALEISGRDVAQIREIYNCKSYGSCARARAFYTFNYLIFPDGKRDGIRVSRVIKGLQR